MDIIQTERPPKHLQIFVEATPKENNVSTFQHSSELINQEKQVKIPS